MHIAAGRNIQILDALHQHTSSQRVTLRHRGAGFAADIFIVFELQALESFRVSADKADHLAGQLTLRVITIGLIEHADAVCVQCLNFFRFR